MKPAKKIIRIGLVALLGLMTVTCQKEEAVMYSPDSDACIKAQQLKTGGVTDYLLDLIWEIEVLVDEGILIKGNGNALIVKLNAAIKNLDKANEGAASGTLVAFMNLVGDLVFEGKITPGLGEELIEVPNAIKKSFDWQCGDPILDLRDGNVYYTVQIGEQCWFSENLAWLPEVIGSDVGSDTEPYYYVYGYEGTDITSAKATDNYDTYGVLYNWTATVNACPSGWHLPSDEAWKTLEKHLGMSESDASDIVWRYSGDVGKKLKSTSGWTDNGNGDNSSGFNALQGGRRFFNGGFFFLGDLATFWSSSEHGSSDAWFRNLSYYSDGVYRYYWFRSLGFSVRCLQD